MRAYWAHFGHLGIVFERLGIVLDIIGASWERLGGISVGLITGTQGRKRRSCSTKLVISGEGWRVIKVELITSKNRFVNSWAWADLIRTDLR